MCMISTYNNYYRLPGSYALYCRSQCVGEHCGKKEKTHGKNKVIIACIKNIDNLVCLMISIKLVDLEIIG